MLGIIKYSTMCRFVIVRNTLQPEAGGRPSRRLAAGRQNLLLRHQRLVTLRRRLFVHLHLHLGLLHLLLHLLQVLCGLFLLLAAAATGLFHLAEGGNIRMRIIWIVIIMFFCIKNSINRFDLPEMYIDIQTKLTMVFLNNNFNLQITSQI